MNEQSLTSLMDFDLGIEQIFAKVNYQGKPLIDGYSIPLDITADEILEEAKFFDLPSGEDYSVYIRHPNSPNDYVFFPSDAKLSDTMKKAGISIQDFPGIEFVIAPEYKGA